MSDDKFINLPKDTSVEICRKSLTKSQMHWELYLKSLSSRNWEAATYHFDRMQIQSKFSETIPDDLVMLGVWIASSIEMGNNNDAYRYIAKFNRLISKLSYDQRDKCWQAIGSAFAGERLELREFSSYFPEINKSFALGYVDKVFECISLLSDETILNDKINSMVKLLTCLSSWHISGSQFDGIKTELLDLIILLSDPNRSGTWYIPNTFFDQNTKLGSSRIHNNAIENLKSRVPDKNIANHLDLQVLEETLRNVSLNFSTTAHNKGGHDGELASQFALLASKLSNWEDFDSVSSLGCAYAQMGDFAKAVSWQTRAVELSGGDSTMKYRLQQMQRQQKVRVNFVHD